MSLLDRIKSIFTISADSDPNAFWLHVRCSRCGTALAVRVDIRNELSADYQQGGYVLVKDMMDSKCFNLMRAELRFDQRRNITSQKIDQGQFITHAEYEATLTNQ